jgi:hypothetical protein
MCYKVTMNFLKFGYYQGICFVEYGCGKILRQNYWHNAPISLKTAMPERGKEVYFLLQRAVTEVR